MGQPPPGGEILSSKRGQHRALRWPPLRATHYFEAKMFAPPNRTAIISVRGFRHQDAHFDFLTIFGIMVLTRACRILRHRARAHVPSKLSFTHRWIIDHGGMSLNYSACSLFTTELKVSIPMNRCPVLAGPMGAVLFWIVLSFQAIAHISTTSLHSLVTGFIIASDIVGKVKCANRWGSLFSILAMQDHPQLRLNNSEEPSGDQ